MARLLHQSESAGTTQAPVALAPARLTPRPTRVHRRHRRGVGWWYAAPVACLVVLPIVLLLSHIVSGTPTPPAHIPKAVPTGYHLILRDRFTGAALDRAVWNPYLTSAGANGVPWNTNDQGGSGPANPARLDELEYDGPAQLAIHSGLSIVARREATPGMLGSRTRLYSWRSGAVSTYGKFEFLGGVVNVIAKAPTAPGMWPGIFMLPGRSAHVTTDNFEVDLFEGGYAVSGQSSGHVDQWALHTPQGDASGTVLSPSDLGAGYHYYGLDWVPGQRISWYLDGRLIETLTSRQIPIPNEPMELLIDLQVASSGASAFHTTVAPTTPATDSLQVSSVTVAEPNSPGT